MRKRGFIVTAAVLAFARPVFADEVDPQVLALMKQASAAEDAGRLQDAVSLYKQAMDIKPTFDVATNLGIDEVELGQWRAGCQHLSYGSARFPVVLKKSIRENANKHLDTAAAHVARVHLQVSTPGADVTVDADKLGLSPVTDVVCIDPGHHDFHASREGYEPGSAPYEAKAGAVDDIHVFLKEKTAGSGHDQPGSTSKPAWPYAVAGGVAAVGVGVGVGLLVWGVTASGAAATKIKNGACQSAPTCNASPELQRFVSRHNTGVVGGAVGLSVAGAGLAGLVIYAVLPAPRETKAATMVAPVLAPGVAGLELQRSF